MLQRDIIEAQVQPGERISLFLSSGIVHTGSFYSVSESGGIVWVQLKDDRSNITNVPARAIVHLEKSFEEDLDASMPVSNSLSYPGSSIPAHLLKRLSQHPCLKV